MKVRFILNIFFIILTVFFISNFTDNAVYAVKKGCPSGWGCSGCDTGCTGEACTNVNCCYSNDPAENSDAVCLSYCEATCPGAWKDSCGPGKKITEEKTFYCGACDNEAKCYKCGPDEPPGPSNTPAPPTATPIPPTATPTPPQRQDICESVTIDKSVLSPGESLTLTTTSSIKVNTFYWALYNLDNLYGPGNAKPICVAPGTGDSTAQGTCPTGTAQLIYFDPDKTTLRFEGKRTLNYNQIFIADKNNADKIPTKVSFSGYLLDANGLASLPVPQCVKNVSRPLPPTATPTPKPPACGAPCSPSNNTCPEECPLCPSGNPICIAATPTPPGGGKSPTPTPPGGGKSPTPTPPGGGKSPTPTPPGGGKSPTPTPPFCGVPCNPDLTQPCPEVCPICDRDNPICRFGNPTPTRTPTPLPPFCGVTCNPDDNTCPLECPLCKPPAGSNDPICIAEATPTPPFCGISCNPSLPNPCPQECPICAPGGNGNECLVATPTPTPPAACDCDSITYSGDFVTGRTVTITTFAVALTDTTKILNMVYHVEKDGVEIAVSEAIPATEIPGQPGRYQTSWDFLVPSGDNAVGNYHVWVKILCTRKTASADSLQAVSREGIASSQVNVVLGEETRKVTFLDSLMSFLSRVFLLRQPTLAPQAAPPTPTGFPGPDNSKPTILVPTGADSLQLGTFHPVINLRLGCKEIWFTIP